MRSIVVKNPDGEPLDLMQIEETVEKTLRGKKLNKVLLIPPDFTRFHSMAGMITEIYYNKLKDSCQIDILPALGTHDPMTRAECKEMFGSVPFELFIEHDWENDVMKIGEVPSSFVNEVSEGLINESIPVEVNKLLMDESYDLIVSIGQVVPHEVVGMANYSKNIFVGCGGSSMINSSHMLGAFYGMERIMGRDFSPVRKVFDYAERNFINNLPLLYFLTVTTAVGNNVDIHGVFTGRNREIFENAVALSQKVNLNYLDEAPEKMVVYLNEKEFKSTWLGNKSIYRTRMAIADNGELIVLAPGVYKFGEDLKVDEIIREYGYLGREKILELVKTDKVLAGNLSSAAHLIHGSSDGRFNITYAVKKMSRQEIEGVNFNYADYDEMVKKYNPDKLCDGWNNVNGEKIYFISNPALGLWAERKKFQ